MVGSTIVEVEDFENDEDGEHDEDDDDLFGIAGISAWDMLGEGFEHAAISTGLFLVYESSNLLIYPSWNVLVGIRSQFASPLYAQGGGSPNGSYLQLTSQSFSKQPSGQPKNDQEMCSISVWISVYPIQLLYQ